MQIVPIIEEKSIDMIAVFILRQIY